jgi:hypothetical protein
MGKAGDVALFFGLSGIVGKQTRSFCAWTTNQSILPRRGYELVTTWYGCSQELGRQHCPQMRTAIL